MKLELRKYFWVFTLLAVALCAYFAAKATTSLVGAQLPEPRQRIRPLSRVLAPRPDVGGARDLTQILARNIFCSTCEPAAEAVTSNADGQQAATGNSDEAVKSALNLKLIATLISDTDAAYSYAAIFESDADKTGLYPIGGKLPGGAAVVEDILERKVMLRNGGRAEYIELEIGNDEPASPTASSRPPPARLDPLAADLSSGVRSLGPNKWEIQRSALNKVLGNTTLLARSARIVPSVRNGKPDGFKLYAIRPGSIYSLIGMQNGDTIHAINGHQMNTPDKALEVYTKVRNASHLSISFSRRGQTKTHDYSIR